MVSTANVREDISNATFQVGSYEVTSTGATTTGSATLHRLTGRITTPTLTTAAATNHVLTLTNSHVTATDMVLANVRYPATGAGLFIYLGAIAGSGNIVFNISNDHAAAAFDSVAVIDFWVFKRS